MRRARGEAWFTHVVHRFSSLFIRALALRTLTAVVASRGRLGAPRRSSIRERRDAGALRAPPRGFIGQITRTTNIPTFIPLALQPFLPPQPVLPRAESLVTCRCVVTTLFLPPPSPSLFLSLFLSFVRCFSHPFLSTPRPFAAARRHFAREERR